MYLVGVLAGFCLARTISSLVDGYPQMSVYYEDDLLTDQVKLEAGGYPGNFYAVIDYDATENETIQQSLSPNFWKWLNNPDLKTSSVELDCYAGDCTRASYCKPFFNCVYSDHVFISDGMEDYTGILPCYALQTQDLSPHDRWECGFTMANVSLGYGDAYSFCGGEQYRLDSSKWYASADEGIQTFIEGGCDPDGDWWQRYDRSQAYSEALGFQLLGIRGFTCLLQNPCNAPLYCQNIGSHLVFGVNRPIIPSRWGYFALSSIENINKQLSNQYLALQSASIKATLATFNIDDIFPKPNKQIFLFDVLTGLGTIFAVVTGFAPALAQPGLGAAGAILPAVGTFFGNYLKESQIPQSAQKDFAPYLQFVYGLFE